MYNKNGSAQMNCNVELSKWIFWALANVWKLFISLATSKWINFCYVFLGWRGVIRRFSNLYESFSKETRKRAFSSEIFDVLNNAANWSFRSIGRTSISPIFQFNFYNFFFWNYIYIYFHIKKERTNLKGGRKREKTKKKPR